LSLRIRLLFESALSLLLPSLQLSHESILVSELPISNLVSFSALCSPFVGLWFVIVFLVVVPARIFVGRFVMVSITVRSAFFVLLYAD
jgi:hypothetical protein